jgi:hypothetical protein
MDLDTEARQRVTPFLQPGEAVLGVGFGSNVVPMAARLVPIVTSQYVGHHILVAPTGGCSSSARPSASWDSPRASARCTR